MKQMATIVIVEGKLMAEVLRPDACQACNACKYGREGRMLLEMPDGGSGYKQGDTIELSLPAGRVAAASAVAYGIPLLGMLVGLYLGYAAFRTDIGAALCAGGMLLVSLLCIRFIEPRIQTHSAFRPIGCPDSQPSNDE